MPRKKSLPLSDLSVAGGGEGIEGAAGGAGIDGFGGFFYAVGEGFDGSSDP